MLYWSFEIRKSIFTKTREQIMKYNCYTNLVPRLFTQNEKTSKLDSLRDTYVDANAYRFVLPWIRPSGCGHHRSTVSLNMPVLLGSWAWRFEASLTKCNIWNDQRSLILSDLIDLSSNLQKNAILRGGLYTDRNISVQVTVAYATYLSLVVSVLAGLLSRVAP